MDAQVAIESAGRREVKKLRKRMRDQVASAYREVEENRSEHKVVHPRVEGLSPSSPEFWESVLGDQFRRYKSSKVNFVRDFVKFVSVALEAFTYYGIEASDVVDTTLTAQNFADIFESGAVRTLCKRLPRSEDSILALLGLSDDRIAQAVSGGDIGPASSVGQVRRYVEKHRGE